MAIALEFRKTDEDLTGRSKWWGFPDMPESLEYPEVPIDEDYSDPLTFICQIRCEELAELDTEGLLPHEGMLWFFGSLDYFLGNPDAECNPGMGEWQAPFFKVLYSKDCGTLHTHVTVYDDGTPACMPAEAISFRKCDDTSDDTRLLGRPYLQEINEQYHDYVSLLQIDENDDWGLRFYDCGMLCMLLQPQDLEERRFQYTKCYLHSF